MLYDFIVRRDAKFFTLTPYECKIINGKAFCRHPFVLHVEFEHLLSKSRNSVGPFLDSKNA